MRITEDSILFSPCAIGRKKAQNRLVAQPMESNDGNPDGSVSERALERYTNLAKGGWGIVVVEAVSVTPQSLANKNGLIIHGKNLDSYKRLVDAFKRINPESLIFFQLTHSGIRSGSFSDVTSVCPVAGKGIRYLGTDEIEGIRRAFVSAVLLTEEAGADGVDFKLGHGYLGTEMLRPANTRDDKWGGSLENRTRFLTDSIRELKTSLKNQDFILGSRVSVYEGIRGGCGTAGPDEQIEDLSEILQIIGMMAGLGMDYVNVTAGLPGTTSEISIPTRASPLFYLDQFRYAKLVKGMNLGIRVIGSAYTILRQQAPVLAEENIRKGYVDFAGFGRQSFADPHYPEKLKRGETVNYCTACSRCGRLIENQLFAGCAIYNEYYRALYRTLRKGKTG